MTRRGAVSLLLILVSLLAACRPGAVRGPTQGPSDLQQWVSAELTPYVAEQFGRHPRFREEPVVIVRLAGDDIQPDIDGLTRGLRDQLLDGLLMTPGVLVPWQPREQQPQHHRRLDQLQCRRQREASYFIGLETTRTLDGRHRVAMRVLDVDAGEWVSGVSRQWTGELSGSELRALQERRTDESLRGLRMLPFAGDQTDLAARYLANNLSCLLRQQDVEDLRIKVQDTDTDDAVLDSLLGLVGNNLSRFREVQITDRVGEANATLRAELHAVRPGLYQAWVILHPGKTGLRLAGVDTSTYLRTARHAASPGQRPQPVTTSMPAPAIAAMELVRRPPGDPVVAACHDPGRACALLELDTEATDAVLVIAHGTADGVSRLSGSCLASTPGVSGSGRYHFRYPQSRYGADDWSTLYAVAVQGEAAVSGLRALEQGLPDACQATAAWPGDARATTDWLTRLDRFMNTHAGQVAWQARRVP